MIVITGRAHCFHEYIYIMFEHYIYIYIYIGKLLKKTYIYIYIYIKSYLKLLLYIERYNHLHRLNPFHKEGIRFFKNSCNGEMGNFAKNGGGGGSQEWDGWFCNRGMGNFQSLFSFSRLRI